jgi:DNA replication protein DnaC
MEDDPESVWDRGPGELGRSGPCRISLDDIPLLRQPRPAPSASLPPTSSPPQKLRPTHVGPAFASGAGDPDCEVCAGAGHFVYHVPYEHPLFGKLQKCSCLEVSQVAAREKARAARGAELTAQLHAELGRLRSCTLEGFFLDTKRRPYPAAVEWGGKSYSSAEQRQTLLKAYGVARTYEPVESLYLYGPYGSGKSHLAAAILNAAAARGLEARYASSLALLRLIRQGFKDRSADDRLEALQTVPLLVIDDLGVENETEWNDASLFDLINARYVAERATIYTSNLAPHELRDPRIASRISGSCLLVKMVAYDFRMLQADADEEAA